MNNEIHYRYSSNVCLLWYIHISFIIWAISFNPQLNTFIYFVQCNHSCKSFGLSFDNTYTVWLLLKEGEIKIKIPVKVQVKRLPFP